MNDGSRKLDGGLEGPRYGATIEGTPSWEGLSHELENMLEHVSSSTHLPTWQELDGYRAHFLRGMPEKSPLHTRFAWGYATPAGGKARRFWIDAVRVTFGLEAYNGPIPACLAHPNPDHLTIAREAINQKQLSLKFVASWGALCLSYGVLIQLLDSEKPAREQFERGNAAAKGSDTTLRRYWYAYYLNAQGVFAEPAGPKRKARREMVEMDLADLCRRIAAGNLPPKVNDKSWFSSMITSLDEGVNSEYSSTANWELKTTYTKLSLLHMDEMLRDRAIGPDILPPLDPNAFGL